MRPNGKYCDDCKVIIKAERLEHNKSIIEIKRLERLAARAKSQKHITRVAPVIITDAEQKLLNKAVDDRYAWPPVTKIYTPAEILAIAHQITPPKYIRHGCSIATTYIDAEPEGRPRPMHREEVNSL